ncbi:uncharacterized protein N0V89_009378 [Didymosphaeria variabile]|uniref:Peptidase M12A domain-containing protein n=1 Tax=Didymosphaeria variabile TaxID=1932322 RepID=A0A9W8XEY3_9PLEO|nr:uncharacterized protein N0V89_009378 [Didymosphaeria variabile]KAJ4348006.1 hypothetical protein N0V89_009378 [Didymosphaeria variabile]
MKILSAACAVFALASPVAAVAVNLQNPSALSVVSGKNVPVGSHPDFIKPRTTWVDGQNAVEWPADPQFAYFGVPLHAIPYCFVNQEAKEKLQHHVWQAMQAWMKALGGDPGDVDHRVHGIGHLVTFQWVQVNCYKDDYRDPSNPGTWNVPGWEHALAIHLVPSGTSSKPGFRPKEKNNEAGRNHMYLQAIPRAPGDSINASPGQLQAFTHELGHVLGLGHAHQHPDAPVKLRCENLPNMDWVIDLALMNDEYKHYKNEPDGRTKLRDFLCKRENYDKAVFAGCAFTEYVTNRPGMKVIGPYDQDSIMHYPTMAHWKDAEGNYHDEVWKSHMPWNPDQATMSHVHADGSEEPFPLNIEISKGDVAAVKSRYPA